MSEPQERPTGKRSLTRDQVEWARQRYFTPNLYERMTQRRLAEELGVTVQTIQRVVRYETYRT
jgi:DNA-binding transcriptional MerR regulator